MFNIDNMNVLRIITIMFNRDDIGSCCEVLVNDVQWLSGLSHIENKAVCRATE